MARKTLKFILALLCTSCVSQSYYRQSDNRDYSLREFSGIYVPSKPLSQEQLRIFGNKIRINDFVATRVANRLLATYQKANQTQPSLTIEIIQESEEPRPSSSAKQLYYLGVNRGSIDLIHYDFDDQHNAFERTLTSLYKNTLKHQREILIYDKADKLKKTKAAGLEVSHHMRLYGRILVMSHTIKKLEDPWTTVFPPQAGERAGTVSATFVRVERPRFDARLRLYDLDHRR